MSDNTLRLLFTGLCAFVPKHDIKKYPGKNQMRVLLAESSEPSDLPDIHMSHPHEAHSPALICRCENVVPGYRKPDLVYYRGGYPWAVFYLDDQDLRIKGAVADSLEVVLGEEAGVGCPTKENKSSFEWVANLEKISPGSEAVTEECLGSSNVDLAVVARVQLKQGKVYTAQLVLDPDGYAILWNYKIPYSPKRGSRHRQAAANIVGFDKDFGSHINLITRRFRKSLNPRVNELFGDRLDTELTIRIAAERGPERVDVWVKCMPWSDIFGTRKPQGYMAEPDVHFSHFYKLSSDYEDANVPHFGRICSLHVDIEHQGNPGCQPARTAPNKKA